MPEISVEHPVTYSSWEFGKFTTYDIVIECYEDSCPLFVLTRSTIPRRYSEFKWLKNRLCKSCPYLSVPPLPPAGCFLTDRFTPEFIEKRRKGLEEFIRRIYAIPTLLSEAAFHLFVQTHLTPREIEGYLNRKWGKHKEVSQVVCELNKQKCEDDLDEICSIASCSRWSDASALSDIDDLDDDEQESSYEQRPSSSSASVPVNIGHAYRIPPTFAVGSTASSYSDASPVVDALPSITVLPDPTTATEDLETSLPVKMPYNDNMRISRSMIVNNHLQNVINPKRRRAVSGNARRRVYCSNAVMIATNLIGRQQTMEDGSGGSTLSLPPTSTTDREDFDQDELA